MKLIMMKQIVAKLAEMMSLGDKDAELKLKSFDVYDIIDKANYFLMKDKVNEEN